MPALQLLVTIRQQWPTLRRNTCEGDGPAKSRESQGIKAYTQRICKMNGAQIIALLLVLIVLTAVIIVEVKINKEEIGINIKLY
jgi:hypothetical protein